MVFLIFLSLPLLLLQGVISVPLRPLTLYPDSDNFVSLLEDAVVNLPPSLFQDDYVLLQKFNESLNATLYYYQGIPVFRRVQRDDEGGKVVVLNPEEDYLPDYPVKRTFTVLKKSEEDDQGYRVFYIYLRENDASDSSPKITWNGTTYTLEFDRWAYLHYLNPQDPTQTVGWSKCFLSVLAPCKYELPQGVASENEQELDEEYLPEDQFPLRDNIMIDELKLRPAEPRMFKDPQGDPDYFDFFSDLEDTDKELLYLRKMVGIYVYTLSAATGAASKQALILAGIKPPVIPPSRVEEVIQTKLADMKRAIFLFQQTINDTSPIDQFVPADDEIAKDLAVIVPENESDMFGRDIQIGKTKPEGGLIRGAMFGLLFGPSGLLGQDQALLHRENQNVENQNVHDQNVENQNVPIQDVENQNVEIQNVENHNVEIQNPDSKFIFGKVITPGDDDTAYQLIRYILTKKNAGVWLGHIAGATLGMDGNGELVETGIRSLLHAGGNIVVVIKKASNIIMSLFAGGGLELALKRANQYVSESGLRPVVNQAVALLTDPQNILMGISYAQVGAERLKNVIQEQDPNYILQLSLTRIPILGLPLLMITGFFSRAIGQRGRRVYGFNMFKNEPRVDTHLFLSIGWRTADINPEDLAYQALLAEGPRPFMGYGNCPLKLLEPSDFVKLTKYPNHFSLMAETYSALFRTQCSDRHKLQLESFLELNLLRIVERGALHLNYSHELLTKVKLSRREFVQLSAAFETFWISNSVISRWYQEPSQVAPSSGGGSSPTVQTLIQGVIFALKEAALNVAPHFVKLSRNLVLTLKTALTKLLQDHDRYKACTLCGPEVMLMSLEDIEGVVGLQEFVINELGGLDKNKGGVVNLEEVYRRFRIKNEVEIQGIVNFIA